MTRLLSQRLLISVAIFTAIACSPELLDPTIPPGNYSQAEEDQIRKAYNTLESSQRACGDAFIKSYQESLFRHCEATDGGERIVGGCGHVAYAWSIHPRVLELALQQCKKPQTAV
nr:putative integron gene cassette protein [uncultured bacterium]